MAHSEYLAAPWQPLWDLIPLKYPYISHFVSLSCKNFNMILVAVILRTAKAGNHFLMSEKIPKPLFINNIKALFFTAAHQTLVAHITWKCDLAKWTVLSSGK